MRAVKAPSESWGLFYLESMGYDSSSTKPQREAMDIIDEANEKQEMFLSRALARQAAQQPIPFSGSCLSCNEPIEKGRYCDSSCREDHERKLKRVR